MAVHINEKQVFPRLLFQRPGLDLRHIQPFSRERLESLKQYSRLVFQT